ncbi:hypothetical protein AA0313_2347 [Acetobacter indonesiensis NRIC 0313]|nr:hypothetical protein AA0313_2347 [Acetobacter indonesiensis NRIC 0313]
MPSGAGWQTEQVQPSDVSPALRHQSVKPQTEQGPLPVIRLSFFAGLALTKKRGCGLPLSWG